jgi:hypothetical protein
MTQNSGEEGETEPQPKPEDMEPEEDVKPSANPKDVEPEDVKPRRRSRNTSHRLSVSLADFYCGAQGERHRGVQGLNPLGLLLCTSIPFIWRILSAFLPA